MFDVVLKLFDGYFITFLTNVIIAFLFFKLADTFLSELESLVSKIFSDMMTSSSKMTGIGGANGALDTYGTLNKAMDSGYWVDIFAYHSGLSKVPENIDNNIVKQAYNSEKQYILLNHSNSKILENNIGYIYCESFSNGIGDGNLDQTLSQLAICDGLIVDVRDNGGGNLTTAQRLAARFTNEKVLVGYMCHKNGPGHSDFSTPKPVYINPSNGIRWQKKVVVLTNRRSYSSTNDFVNSMGQFPNVIIVGDKTGGGSGLPFSSEIPCGWSIRFSAAPMFDPQMNQLEFGIDPDVKVDMSATDMQQGKDTMKN